VFVEYEEYGWFPIRRFEDLKQTVGVLVLYLIFISLRLVLALVAWRIVAFGEAREEKLSSFECGFVSFQGSRLTFSLQFFLIAIIFLIFDVEIALILPVPVVFEFVRYGVLTVIFFVFRFVVLGGLYYEWGCGVLDWAY
jgi:NADH:ubiquinone oxidoreductase subunit 3 (subunit A)